MLEEKKRKKEREAEEKEERKKEREKRKLEREALQQLKREERLERQKKKEEEMEKKKKQPARRGRRKVNNTNPGTGNSSGTPSIECPSVETGPPCKKLLVPLSLLSKKKYAFCFGNFCTDGEEWLKCACSRWVHEKCMEDVHLDENGEERFCPLCLNAIFQ
jgi:hypothetical protein